MGLKTLLLYVVILLVTGGIGYAFIAGTNILSIRDLAIPTINLSTITQALGGVASTIQGFLAQYNINPITLMIGAIPAAISGIYALIRYRAEQQAKQAMMQAQQQTIDATNYSGQLQGRITEQTQTINQLQSQLQSQATLEQKATALQSQLDAQTTQLQQTQTRLGEAQQLFSQFGVVCRWCGTKFLKNDRNECPYCHRLQVVA